MVVVNPVHGTLDVGVVLVHSECDDVVPFITSSLLDIIRDYVLDRVNG